MTAKESAIWLAVLNQEESLIQQHSSDDNGTSNVTETHRREEASGSVTATLQPVRDQDKAEKHQRRKRPRSRKEAEQRNIIHDMNHVDAPMLEHNINGTHHHDEGVLEPNIALGAEENGMELVVPEFDNNYTYLPPVDGHAMMPVDERPIVYGPNLNQELQFGSGYNFYNPSAVFVNNQEQDLIEMNPSHNNGFEASVGVLQPHGLHEEGVAGRDLPPQFQSDSNILSPFNELAAFESSTFYSGFDSYGAFDDDFSWFGA
ncbi:ETHYLENE INSENSITIVE 3-like 3 protein [Raphanus sativus]|nr:ETHYLENE INSENSITIVE 3-like 3 protein [Raphanus sativus]